MNNTHTIIKNDLEKFKSIVANSTDISEILRAYQITDNGQRRRDIKSILLEYSIDTNHFYRRSKTQKHPFIEKQCPVCKTTFPTQTGTRDEKTVCSHKCSNIFFSDIRHTEESKEKVRQSIRSFYLLNGVKTGPITINCKICGKEKLTLKKSQQCCSTKCARKLIMSSPTYIVNLKAGIRRSIEEGRHKPWSSRNILSYPEKFFIQVLKNNSIQFEPNKPFLGYFLDFAISDKMVDLEIDGKQHKYPDRRESDSKRDNILTENGWKVYRIDWNEINTYHGKQSMKDKISKFLEYYKNL